jgi:hypothetical protein
MLFGRRVKGRSSPLITLNNQTPVTFNNNHIGLGDVHSSLTFKSRVLKPVIEKKEEVFVDKDEGTIYKTDTFNWIHYILLNPDLFYANITTRELAMEHYIKYGKSEDRATVMGLDQCNDYVYMYTSYKTDIKVFFFDSIMEKKMKETYNEDEWKLFNKHPHLFHKYLLFTRNPNAPIQYKIAKNTQITKKYICAIHCYDLNLFDDYFYSYLEPIRNYFDIVVTYCLDDCDIINKYNFTFIIGQNNGMDIGGKFIAVKFLNDMKIDYDHIFFIHSKNDKEKRHEYISPFVSNIKKIVSVLNLEKNLGCVFPNLIHFGKAKMHETLLFENLNEFNYGLNANIIDELLSCYNLPQSLLFAEGNVYILTREIANDLFGDLKIFNALNDENSFDYNWVKSFYCLDGQLMDVYSKFKTLNLFGNANYYSRCKRTGLGRDYMIEHAFERIIVSTVIKHKKKILCANFENTHLDKIQKRLFRFVNELSENNSYTLEKVFKYMNEFVAGRFKCSEYLKLNADLAECFHSYEEAVNHWVTYGIKENRIFNFDMINMDYTDFLNMKFYNKLYDLKTTYISTINYSCKISNEIAYTKIKMGQFIENIPKTPMDNLINYNSFIFIVDFPMFGGGTTIFLNTIISKYKETQTFLIYRRFEDQNYFFINDEILLERGFNDDEFINILNTVSSKINKIFINSIIGHNKNLLDYILNLNKHVTIITHDHSNICNENQMYYHNIDNLDFTDSVLDINKVNCIVTQNEKNLSIYGKYLNNQQEVVISELPDYKKSILKIETDNENIVIGVNGNISYIKGFVILKKFVERMLQWRNIKLVIFGHCLDPDYPYQYCYNNIDEFNALIQEHKPNLWLELSMWPETYSYTLTQMMLSKLPIFYQKKNYPSVIENRLSTYSKAYSFDNIDNISYGLIKSLKQNYFYNVEPVIYYGKFWNDYFGGETNSPLQSREKNVVFVSSKIYTSNEMFTYSETRSIYSPIERFKQTLNTISSIRINIPDSFIIMFDNSDFSSEQLNELNSLLDLFINIQTDPVINDYTNVKTTKAYGELAQTQATIKHIKTNMNYLNIKQFFKISGRYLINETFNYENYNNDFNIFKRNSEVVDRNYYYTSFYKISGINFNNYCESITNMYNYSKINDNYFNMDWEVILTNQLNYNVVEIPNLGITQNIAVWNQIDKI